MTKGERAQSVLAEPQFTISTVMRPYDRFEDDYQGQSVSRHILLGPVLAGRGPGGIVRDPLAEQGQAGYDPNLLRGLDVPIGTRVVFWFPAVLASSGGQRDRYRWTFVWRFRNVRDYTLARKPYALKKASAGQNDTTATPPERVVIPACYQPVVYNQPEPGVLTGTFVTQNAYREDMSFGIVSETLRPFLPGGVEGVYQQGVLDPATSATDASSPFFLPAEAQSLGNEVMIGVSRDATLGATWDFTAGTGADRELSDLLGRGTGGAFPDVGVYVVSGVAP